MPTSINDDDDHATAPSQSLLMVVQPDVREEDREVVAAFRQMTDNAENPSAHATTPVTTATADALDRHRHRRLRAASVVETKQFIWWNRTMRVAFVMSVPAVIFFIFKLLQDIAAPNSGDLHNPPRTGPTDYSQFVNASLNLSRLVDTLRNGQTPVRGVNLNGWLVAEYSMSWDSPLWHGVPQEIAVQGEYKTMQFLGHAEGDPRFQRHRETWITEQDLQVMVRYDLNTVRVPVGFWIVGDGDLSMVNAVKNGTDLPEPPPSPPQEQPWQVYAPGALAFLDKLLLEWSPKYKLAVLISLDAHQGAQNDTASTIADQHEWHWSDDNMDTSVALAVWLAQRYHDATGFLGLSLMNEPTVLTSQERLQNFYLRCYHAIRDSGNDCVLGISPLLALQNGSSMEDFMVPPGYYHVWQEWHPHFDQFDSSSEAAVLEQVDAYGNSLVAWHGDALLLSDWSLRSPASAPFTSDYAKRQLAMAQTRAFHRAQAGWTFTSWRHADEAHATTNGSACVNSMRQNLRKDILGPFVWTRP